MSDKESHELTIQTTNSTATALATITSAELPDPRVFQRTLCAFRELAQSMPC